MKNIFKVFSILVVFFSLLSCSTNNKSKTIDDLINHFNNNEIKGEKSMKAFALIGAIDGISYRGDDFSIEIYKFHDSDKIPTMLTNKNGYFGMLIHKPSEGDLNKKLVDTFNNFK